MRTPCIRQVLRYLNTFLLCVVDVTPVKKKRGRPPKQGEQQEEAAAARKARRVLNRFDGMSVDEVMARTLPDVITNNLDILIVSLSPWQQLNHLTCRTFTEGGQPVTMVTFLAFLLRLALTRDYCQPTKDIITRTQETTSVRDICLTHAATFSCSEL